MKTSSANIHRMLFGLIIALSLVCIGGIVFFFVHMYQRDMQTLTNFMASYQEYDQAIAAASAPIFAENGKNTPNASDEELRVDEALSDLKTKSSLQISSLIKNEKEAMRTMQEIADLSDKETSTLKTYRMDTGQNINREGLEQTFHDLTKERQAAFAHFQELGR